MLAQDNPLSSAIKMQYGMGKGVIIRAAEKMPEGDYAFKPTDQVRSFGQVVGHVADAQYMFCSAVAGEKSPATGSVEKTKTAKAAEMVKFFGRDSVSLGVLSFNNMHNYEHYGNIVTYLRLKNIVPPSSEPRGEMKKQ